MCCGMFCLDGEVVFIHLKQVAKLVLAHTVQNIAPIADVLGRPDQSARLISDW